MDALKEAEPMIIVCRKDPNDVIWILRCANPVLYLEFGTYDDALKEARQRGRSIRAALVVYAQGISSPRKLEPGY